MTRFSNAKTGARLPPLPPEWAAVKLAGGPKTWAQITPLVRLAIARQIAPCGVDESLLRATLAAALDRKVANIGNIEKSMRLGWNRVAAASPELDLEPVEKHRRPAPRRDQWEALEPALQEEIARFIAELGRTPSADVAVKNKILRALEAADEDDAEIETLGDLFGERGIAAMLGNQRLFGKEGEQHESRSDILEFARKHARTAGDVDRLICIQNLIDDKETLPTARSPVSPGDLLAVGVLLKKDVFERLAARTIEVVDAFVAEPTRDNLTGAQVGLLIRLTVALSLFRKVAVRLSFEGSDRRTTFGLRPTLVLDPEMPPVEASLSAETVKLLDRFFEAHRIAFGPPALLFAHADGRPKTAAHLSNLVRLNGQAVDLELSPTILRTYTVAKLVQHMKADGGSVDVTRLKDHLGIDQAINFESRFGALLRSDVFEQLTAVALKP